MNKMLLALSIVSVVTLYADSTPVKNNQAQKDAASTEKTASALQAKADKYWRNTDFSEWTKDFNKSPKSTMEIKDNLIPKFWVLNSTSGKLSMETKEDNPQDKYLKLTNCRIYQQHKGEQKKYKVILDAKGTGKLVVYANCYERIFRGSHVLTGKGCGSRAIFTIQPSADKWQTFQGEVSKDAKEILGIVLSAKGEVSVDNMFVIPVDDNK